MVQVDHIWFLEIKFMKYIHAQTHAHLSVMSRIEKKWLKNICVLRP